MDLDAPLVLMRWVYYCAATVLFGSALFRLYAGPWPHEPFGKPSRTGMTILAAAAFLSAVLWLLRFAATLDGPEGTLETARAILFESSLGAAWLIRLLGAGLALVAATVGRSRAIAAAMLAALACEGWSGHAASWGSPAAWRRPSMSSLRRRGSADWRHSPHWSFAR